LSKEDLDFDEILTNRRKKTKQEPLSFQTRENNKKFSGNNKKRTQANFQEENSFDGNDDQDMEIFGPKKKTQNEFQIDDPFAVDAVDDNSEICQKCHKQRPDD